MKKIFLLFLISLLTLSTVADEYTDPETNVIYVYKQGIPNATVKCGDVADWDNGDTEYVSGNPDAKGDVRILDKFTVNNEEYVVTGIGSLSFVLNKDITSVFIPSTIENVDMESFLECSSLKNVYMSERLKTIGYRAFSGCVSLSSLELPEGLERIGFEAFASCTALKSVHIPSSVTTIGRLPFLECDNLESLSVADGNMFFDSREGCNAVIEKATDRLVIGCKTTVIPLTVVSVGEEAFSRCGSLKEIVIPESVKTIESNAFYRCKGLTEVILPQSLQSIGESAFAQTAIQCITIPSGVESIGLWAFSSSTIETVISLIEEPFAVPDLCNFPRPNPILFVPAGTKGIYEATNGWNRFKSIIVLDEAGMVNFSIPKYAKTPLNTYFDLCGCCLDCLPPRGIYIQNGRKVVVR